MISSEDSPVIKFQWLNKKITFPFVIEKLFEEQN